MRGLGMLAKPYPIWDLQLHLIEILILSEEIR